MRMIFSENQKPPIIYATLSSRSSSIIGNSFLPSRYEILSFSGGAFAGTVVRSSNQTWLGCLEVIFLIFAWVLYSSCFGNWGGGAVLRNLPTVEALSNPSRRKYSAIRFLPMEEWLNIGEA